MLFLARIPPLATAVNHFPRKLLSLVHWKVYRRTQDYSRAPWEKGRFPTILVEILKNRDPPNPECGFHQEPGGEVFKGRHCGVGALGSSEF